MIGDVDQLIAYAAARGVAVAEDEAPVLLVKATDYLNTLKWVGKKPAGQDDSWPRTGLVFNGTPLYDEDGDQITTIELDDGTEAPLEDGDTLVEPPVTPRDIQLAAYRLAVLQGTGTDIMGDSAPGAKVLEERVEGAVTVKYAEGSLYDPLKITGFISLIENWLLCVPRSGVNFNVERG